jgi:hypothetical protein
MTATQILLVGLAEVAPVYGMDPKTLRRHATSGWRGPDGRIHRLRAVRCGRNWKTTLEWCEEHFASITAASVPAFA